MRADRNQERSVVFSLHTAPSRITPSTKYSTPFEAYIHVSSVRRCGVRKRRQRTSCRLMIETFPFNTTCFHDGFSISYSFSGTAEETVTTHPGWSVSNCDVGERVMGDCCARKGVVSLYA